MSFCSSYCCLYFSAFTFRILFKHSFCFPLNSFCENIDWIFEKKIFLNELIEIIALSNIIKCNCDLLSDNFSFQENSNLSIIVLLFSGLRITQFFYLIMFSTVISGVVKYKAVESMFSFLILYLAVRTSFFRFTTMFGIQS